LNIIEKQYKCNFEENVMKYILAIILSVVLPILSLKEMKPKFCINCKYFMKDNFADKYGLCSLFPKTNENYNFLVDGIVEKENIEYYHCSVARKSDRMCGKEGKMYKKELKKNRELE